MIIRKVFTQIRCVTLTIGVAQVRGKKPIVGLTEEVERNWQKWQTKLNVKLKTKRRDRSLSNADVDRVLVMKRRQGSEMKQSIAKFKQIEQDALECKPMRKMLKYSRDSDVSPHQRATMEKVDRVLSKQRRSSNLNASLSKFRQIEADAEAAKIEDVYNPDWKPPKFDKTADDYGRPKPGSLTEARGIAAGNDIAKEIIRLCETIDENGLALVDGSTVITFGKLFSIYTRISDKVVGMLMRARKHKMVTFDGEMLYQRRDDDVLIYLIIPLNEVQKMYSQSDDPNDMVETEGLIS